MHEDFTLFIGKTNQNRQKSYLVANTTLSILELENAAKKYFRVSSRHIYLRIGWVVGDDLYLKNPKLEGQRKVYVASFCT